MSKRQSRQLGNGPVPMRRLDGMSQEDAVIVRDIPHDDHDWDDEGVRRHEWDKGKLMLKWSVALTSKYEVALTFEGLERTHLSQKRGFGLQGLDSYKTR